MQEENPASARLAGSKTAHAKAILVVLIAGLSLLVWLWLREPLIPVIAASVGTKDPTSELGATIPVDERRELAPIQASEPLSSAAPIICFEDQSGCPIPEVQAWLSQALGSRLESFVSDRSGTLVIPAWGKGEPLLLQARPVQYLPFAIQLELPHPAKRVIRLRQGESISGLVLDSDSRVVETRPTVLAFRSGRPPTKEDLYRALSGQPSVITHAKAQPDGAFEIGGLEKDEEYTLLAGGGGVVVTSAQPCRSGATNVLVRTESLFAARIAFEGMSSGQVLWEPPGPQWFWDPGLTGGAGVDADSLSGILAGFAPSETTRLPAIPLAFLFAGSPARDSVGPISFRGTPAGFDPIDEKLWIPRASDSIPTIVIAARPRVFERGEASIRFQGLLESEVDPANRAAPLGIIWFRSRDGGATFSQPIVELSSCDLLIRGIPCGLYEVSLSTESGFANHSTLERFASIGTDGPALLTFDMRQSCEVEIVAQDLEGNSVDREVVVEVKQKVDEEIFCSFVTLRRPPYVIQGLIPGEYGFILNKPYFEPQPIWTSLSKATRSQAVVFLPR